MILEVATLDIQPGRESDFEVAFGLARVIITKSAGFVSLELQRCIETPHRYILLVRWRSLEDHTIGFRQSADYERWKALLHHFYDPFPLVQHYAPVTQS
jgi:heme-degrading monooxygenase HmoA